MIIYGSKATLLKTESITDKCTHCTTAGNMLMSIFQKYGHVFWIPFFPMGKTGATVCQHCKQVLAKKQWPPSLQENYEALKVQTKTPVWTFSGLAILIVLISWGVITSKQKDEKNAQLVMTPQQGDVYEIKYGYKRYTLYKVASVASDSVYLLTNDYETNKISGLRDLKVKGDKAYSGDILPLSKTELKTMFDKGDILDVDR